MTPQIALTKALVLALTAPDAARERAADALVDQLAYTMPPDDIEEAKRQALVIMDGVTA
jgi:hypothetical protein